MELITLDSSITPYKRPLSLYLNLYVYIDIYNVQANVSDFTPEQMIIVKQCLCDLLRYISKNIWGNNTNYVYEMYRKRLLDSNILCWKLKNTDTEFIKATKNLILRVEQPEQYKVLSFRFEEVYSWRLKKTSN